MTFHEVHPTTDLTAGMPGGSVPEASLARLGPGYGEAEAGPGDPSEAGDQVAVSPGLLDAGNVGLEPGSAVRPGSDRECVLVAIGDAAGEDRPPGERTASLLGV